LKLSHASIGGVSSLCVGELCALTLMSIFSGVYSGFPHLPESPAIFLVIFPGQEFTEKSFWP